MFDLSDSTKTIRLLALDFYAVIVDLLATTCLEICYNFLTFFYVFMQEHEEECGYVDIECPNGCGEMIRKRDKQTHNDVCPFREEPCEYCNVEVTASQRNVS